jgi:hypothetical protein
VAWTRVGYNQATTGISLTGVIYYIIIRIIFRTTRFTEKASEALGSPSVSRNLYNN